MRLSDWFIRALCIASVLLYTASATLIANPQTQISKDIVTKLLKIEDGSTSKFTTETVTDEFVLTKVSAKVNSLEPLFKIIGAYTQPVKVVVDHDHPYRISTGATDIILGNKVVLAEGQFEHALIKSWIIQKSSSAILADPVKVEVTCDLLLATFKGSLRLADPQTGELASFSKVKSWNQDLMGTAGLCDSPWRPAELIPFCKSLNRANDIASTPYSFRKVIGSLIWKDISQVSLFSREESLIEIAEAVQSATEESHYNGSTYEASSLSALQQQIETQARRIFPSLNSTLGRADLSVVLKRGEKFSLLNGFVIDSKEADQASKVVIEACVTPSAEQILSSTSERAEHILLVQNCGDTKIHYEGFSTEGIKTFAMQNRSVKFAYLHRQSLKLASKMLNNFDVIAMLNSDIDSKDAKFLGLDQKIFRSDLDAFKVNGPIGAVEWFRTSATESESRS